MGAIDPFQPEQLALFQPRVCSVCPLKDHCPAEHSTRACRDDPHNGFVDPARHDITTLLAELGSLDLGLSVAVRQAIPELPAFISQVDGTAVSRGRADPWVVINLGVFMRRAGFRRPRSQATLHERLGLPAATRIVLLAFGPDRFLDQELWPNRAKFVAALDTWRPNLVVAPDFSVWRGDPWLTQRVNIVRSLRMFEAIQAAGISAVPHVYWSSREDALEWAGWLRLNPVPLIAVDLQCIGYGLRNYLRELAAFRQMLDYVPRILVSGVRPGARMQEIRTIWPEASFTADLIRLAAKRRELVCGPDGRCTVEPRPGADPAQLYGRMALTAERQVTIAASVAA